MYCIDTSALVDGWIRYYPPDVFPPLWTKLEDMIHATYGESGGKGQGTGGVDLPRAGSLEPGSCRIGGFTDANRPSGGQPSTRAGAPSAWRTDPGSGLRGTLRGKNRRRRRVDRRVHHSHGARRPGPRRYLDLRGRHRAVPQKRSPWLYGADHAFQSGRTESVPARGDHLGGCRSEGHWPVAGSEHDPTSRETTDARAYTRGRPCYGHRISGKQPPESCRDGPSACLPHQAFTVWRL